MKSIIGTKIGMTRVFDDNGRLVPVTVIKVDKCWTVGLKTIEKNGYNAVQLGFSLKKEKKITKPYKGIFKDINNGDCPLLVKEIRLNEKDLNEYSLGQEIFVDMFEKGDYVDISAVTKGKGFAGVIKRHGFGGLPASHGNGEYRRAPGSIGASSYPSRVFKGQRMPGRLGGENITIQKLEIVNVILEDKLILVKGATPGVKGVCLKIKETTKALKKKKIVIATNTELKLNKKR
jgi:large subunit ribosomal protein L3